MSTRSCSTRSTLGPTSVTPTSRRRTGPTSTQTSGRSTVGPIPTRWSPTVSGRPRRSLAPRLGGRRLQPIDLWRSQSHDRRRPPGRLFSNPLSSLVQCKPGDRVLIRFANLGFLDHSIVFPGLEVDVLGRDARYVPASEGAQRRVTDSIQIGPGESRDVFFTAPATPGDYAFYDRGMSHFTGSADGTDAWVGGQRSAVRVVAGLADQIKPNGWGGEGAFIGEFPIKAYPRSMRENSRLTTRVQDPTGAAKCRTYHPTYGHHRSGKPRRQRISPCRSYRRKNNNPPPLPTGFVTRASPRPVRTAPDGRLATAADNGRYYWVLADSAAAVQQRLPSEYLLRRANQ